jgi:hypothetical protein
MIQGSEPRNLMDNWFRAQRRAQELGEALRKRGMPFPPRTNLYRDIDIEPTATGFATWYRERTSADPDRSALEALAAEWLEGALPGTENAISPHRVEHLLALVGDWFDDDLVARLQALLPDWLRWNADRSGLPEPFLDRALVVAGGERRTGSVCPPSLDAGTEVE